MSVELILDSLCEWTTQKICSKLTFKKPSLRGDSGYDYTRVNPSVFPMICPTEDKTPLPKSPSVTIQLDTFSDDLTAESTLKLAMIFCVWNTGEHDTGNETFTKNYDGWRDLWRFIDTARKAIRYDFSVAGYEVTGDISGRPLVGDDALNGTYPYFFGELTFSIKTVESTTGNADLRKLL